MLPILPHKFKLIVKVNFVGGKSPSERRDESRKTYYLFFPLIFPDAGCTKTGKSFRNAPRAEAVRE
jgi:hypothetical protein